MHAAFDWEKNVSQQALSFEALQARIDAAFPETEQPAEKTERASLYLMLFGIALAFLAGLLAIDTMIGKVLIVMGLALELIGGVTLVVLSGRRLLRGIRFDDQSGAKEFELDFVGFQQVASWLRCFPEDQLRSRLVFISHRVDGWRYGTSFVLGSLEKLGILPVFVALFLQFKDTKQIWPPDFTLPGGLLALAVVLFYWIGLWASARKMQATRFERHLKIALDPDFKIGNSSNTIHAPSTPPTIA